jgi:hypothetical protein
MSINSTQQHILVAVFLLAWLGEGAILLWRYRTSQSRYLHQFPPVEGVPLDMYVGGGPRTVTRALRQALFQPQRDARLEQLREGVWRRYGYLSAWTLGFPTICVGLFVLSELTGLVHLLR